MNIEEITLIVFSHIRPGGIIIIGGFIRGRALYE